MIMTTTWHLKVLMFLYAFEESVDCHLLSSFCDDSNLHISLFKYVLSTMGVSKESISKFLIGNRFHVKSRILSPYSNRIFTWNRFPIKNLLIDSLLTPIVESTYLTTTWFYHGENTDRPPLELDVHWTNLHTFAFTQLQYSIVNNSATNKLFVSVILGIYTNCTTHSQPIGH